MTLNCFLQTLFQQRCTCRCCGKRFRGRWHACLSCVTLCIRDVFYKSRSLELECKVGGNFHPRLIMIVKPIANKYHEGNMKRTLKRGLKVLEIAELEAKDVWVPMIDCCHCMLLDWFATCKPVHGVVQGLCCCRGVLVPLCVGACVPKHGSPLVECVNARLLLRHIRCNGFFGNVSTFICGGGSYSCVQAIETSEWTSFDPSWNTDQGV